MRAEVVRRDVEDLLEIRGEKADWSARKVASVASARI